MINKNIGVTPRTAASPARLRADRIRRDTLTMLAAALADDHENDVLNALDELIDAVAHNAPDVQINALVGDIEDVADMGRAAMDLTASDVSQLADEAMHAHAIGAGSVVALPQQQDRRAS
ncbi:hypothetical protein [Streptomyces sp. CA-111067]|uniref:hypothetical protein n=1 Tax=Streptomyces sp. CA-111067 TaxID=3240046 RepID=UPI003D96D3B3